MQPTRRQFAGAAALGLGAAAAGSPASAQRGDTQPNVIVIVADDLGYADVGFQGLREFDTPNIDRLANSGVRFTNGYVAHPYCSPSRAAILTGRYPHRFGHEHNPSYAPDDARIGTAPDELLLGQVLRGARYRTAAVGKWHLGDAPELRPHRRGFDEFFGFSGGGFNYCGAPRPGEAAARILRNDAPVDPKSLTYLTDDFTEESVKFIRTNAAQPFFLYLAYNAPHAPDQAPRKYLDRANHIEYGQRSVYAAMTIAMDDGIGRILETLTELKLRNNTLIWFVSDNGGRRDGSDNRPLRGHKGLLFEGGIRVPFAVSWPSRLPAGRTFEQPVSAMDIFPTCSAAAGAEVTGGKPLDGVNLLPHLSGRVRSAPHDTLFWREIAGQGYAVRRGPYKLVKPAAFESDMLFDLSSDPRETTDLAASKPGVARELKDVWSRWSGEMVSPRWTDEHGQNVRKERQAVLEPRQRALPPAQRPQSR